jgi:hypothetical protein
VGYRLNGLLLDPETGSKVRAADLPEDSDSAHRFIPHPTLTPKIIEEQLHTYRENYDALQVLFEKARVNVGGDTTIEEATELIGHAINKPV